MEDIAEASGVSRATVYRYVSGRQEPKKSATPIFRRMLTAAHSAKANAPANPPDSSPPADSRSNGSKALFYEPSSFQQMSPR